MVGVNFFLHHIGAVAFFATLFVAALVNAELGCVFDFEHDNLSADFELECNDVKNTWKISEFKSKKTLSIDSEQNGCLRTRHTIPLNSTTKVSFRFMYEGSKDDNAKITIKLKPAEGSCRGEECVWQVNKDPKFKFGEWMDFDHLFPINATKQYFIQLQIGKSKGKFFVDHISVPDARNEAGKCHTGSQMKIFDSYKALKVVNVQKVQEGDATTAAGSDSSSDTKGESGSATEGGEGDDSTGKADSDEGSAETAAPETTPGSEDSTNSSAVTYTLLSKNLMFTTASVLTLNNLLN